LQFNCKFVQFEAIVSKEGRGREEKNGFCWYNGAMSKLSLYPGQPWQPAHFVERLNRFVMRFEKEGRIIEAHTANPGRMEEFRLPGHPFFLVPHRGGKYPFRVVSTVYQGAFVLLDTIKVNHIMEILLHRRLIPEFSDSRELKREVSLHRSKFDFMLKDKRNRPLVLEVKSCNLCHRGVAMFPDAPTSRGRRHLQDLAQLADEGIETCVFYLITNWNARVFMPNVHTDPDYCRTFVSLTKVKSLAYKIKLTDPVTVDLDSLRPVPIDMARTMENCRDRGSYLLVLENENDFSKKIGRLGERRFQKGFYVYVGSALNGLSARIRRHQKMRKKIHWHLDYIVPSSMKIRKIYPIRRRERLEVSLAQRLTAIAGGYIDGFGASDTANPSHLFYFPQNPVQKRTFLDALFDFQMMVE
jgi:sugar fermentation stimulation protein A